MKKTLVMAMTLVALTSVFGAKAEAAEMTVATTNGKIVATETVDSMTKDVAEATKEKFVEQGWVVSVSAFANTEYDWYNKVMVIGSIDTLGNALNEWSKTAGSNEYKGTDTVVESGSKTAATEAGKVRMVGPADKERDYRETLNKIPTEVLKAFNASGWRVVYGANALDGLDIDDSSVIGTTVYADKTIYTTKPSTLIHEMGHFVDVIMNSRYGTDACNTLRSNEGNKASGTLTKYECSQDVEYFAGYFRAYVNSIGNETKLNNLKAKTPETFEYFTNLANSGWVLSK